MNLYKYEVSETKTGYFLLNATDNYCLLMCCLLVTARNRKMKKLKII
jgi:hypothetical protein